LLREFGRRSYANQVYLNFEREPALAGLFAEDLDPHRIITEVSILRSAPIDPATTLLVFDEIQECPQALTALKYFAEEAPEYSVAAAGSLLGLAVHGTSSFPVGKVDFLDLYPLSFEEFLTASGNGPLGEYLGTLRPGMTIAPALAAKAESLLSDYLLVGGMPEAVASWLGHHDAEQVEHIHQAVLDSYVLDMAKHATPNLFPKLTAIWRSIPQQLAKENAKFVFSQVVAGARAKDLEDALEWLVSAGVCVKVTKVSRPAVPLASYADDRYFKLYLSDVGLLRRLADVPAAMFLRPGESNEHFRGALIENYVLTQLVATQPTRPYFWRSENTAEVDFLVQIGGDVVPIEVKAGTSTAAKSLRVYQQKYAPRHALTVSLKPALNGQLPLYAVGGIAGYLAS
jgi:predicted AAA+ superfamily ATPase